MSNPQSDDELWRIAKKRAAFRRHLLSYIIITGFLWLIWWFTTGRNGIRHGVPWPIWVMLGWGIGLGFNYFAAYGESTKDMIEKEYEKLKKERDS